MFIKILISYLIGYLNISVEGYYIERFINICKNNKILIWNLKKKKDVKIFLNINIREFKTICKIAKKTKCKIKIESKRGLPFLLNKYRKRKIFAILLIILIIVIAGSSNFIWNIETKEKNGKELKNIEDDLKEAGLNIGKMKQKIDTKNIINDIRLKRKDIAWIGIQLKGTNAIVKVVKTEEKPDIIDEEEYCNIIADKKGMITKINAQNGTANVKVGDIIKEGDVLVKGWMEGKYTGVRYVHAKADIEAKIWHTKNKKIMYKNVEKQETGNIEKRYSIKINNFRINLDKRLSKFQKYDILETENKLRLFSDFYLPISIVETINKEQKEIEKIYTVEEAKKIGIEELSKQLDSEIINKEKIVNKNINTYEKENGIEIFVTYEVLENIGTNEKIVF